MGAFDIKGHIITIDTMGCEVEISNNIAQKEADYVFSLKRNQENLCEDVEAYFKDHELKNNANSSKTMTKGMDVLRHENTLFAQM